MRSTEHPIRLRAAAREQDSSLFVALELSKSVWLGRVDGFNQHHAARKTDDG